MVPKHTSRTSDHACPVEWGCALATFLRNLVLPKEKRTCSRKTYIFLRKNAHPPARQCTSLSIPRQGPTLTRPVGVRTFGDLPWLVKFKGSFILVNWRDAPGVATAILGRTPWGDKVGWSAARCGALAFLYNWRQTEGAAWNLGDDPPTPRERQDVSLCVKAGPGSFPATSNIHFKYEF